MNYLDILHDNSIKYPDKVIWEDNEKQYTFLDLEVLSGKIYRYLKENNISTEDIVAIKLPRSGRIPVAMIGALKTGCAYIVLGEHSEKKIIDYQLKETKPKLIIDFEKYNQAMEKEPLTGYHNSQEHDLATIVYSSGSNGYFKGSMHEYGALINATKVSLEYDKDLQNNVPLPIDYRALFSSGFYSISAVINLIDNIISCCYSYILPYEDIGNMEKIAKVLIDKKINYYVASARDYQFIKKLNSPYLTSITYIYDMFSCNELKGLPLYNYYGMTESCCILTSFLVDKKYDIVPVGKPITNKQFKIVDEHDNTVKNGEIGELCFENTYFRGYVNHPKLTSEVLKNGWFHTGDMCYLNEDDNYVIVGRKIDIMKTKYGYIIPMKISVAFKNAFSEVENCYVKLFGTQKNPIICLYYLGEKEYTIDEVRNVLKDKIPNFSLPTHCQKVDKFDFFPSGKINRKSFKNLAD